MLVLLADVRKKERDAVAQALRGQGYSVDLADSHQQVIEMAGAGIYDLLVLNDDPAGLVGIELLETLRRFELYQPILLLVDKENPQLRVKALDAGADDCLPKPYIQEELLARIRALLRRQGTSLQNRVLQGKGFSFNPVDGSVDLIDGERLWLTGKESRMLELLLGNHDMVLEKGRIYDKIWGYNSMVDFANVDLYVHYLRKKLRTDCIQTIRGVGYVWRQG